MKKLTFVLLLVSANSVFGQSADLARAEFERFEYDKSAQIYASLNAENQLKTEDLSRLVYSQYVNGDFANCLVSIDALMAKKAEEPMHYLMRADALKATGRYAEAKDAYALYLTKDPSDNVQVDMASCDYLVNSPVITGALTSGLANNTRKADNRFYDAAIGTIAFHEIGEDSSRTKLELAPADFAELMLMRPFTMKDGTEQLIAFQRQFDESSITSFSKDPKSNTVVFTVVELLSSNAAKRAPHLYIGEWNADNNSVESAKLWKYSEMETGGTTAFACFIPAGNGIIFSAIKPNSTTYSDFYFSGLMNGDWTEPRVLEGINTVGFETYPMFDNKGQFSFSTTGRVGCGALDAYAATFNELTMNVSDIVNYPQPINSFSDDYWVLTGNDTSFVTSNRFGSRAEDDVWMVIDQEKINREIAEKEVKQDLTLAKKIIENWKPPQIFFHFETNEPNTSYSFLDSLASILQSNPAIDVEIVGYTDIRGDEMVNRLLSEARSQFVINELQDRGIPVERMHKVGKGEEQAKRNSVENSPEIVHQLNRFVEIDLILKPGGKQDGEE